MLKFFTLAILSVVIFFTGCKKDNYLPDPNLYTPTSPLPGQGIGTITPLNGKWNWVKGISSTAGISSPGISNYTEGLDFGTDSIMTIYRNNLYYYQFKYKYTSDYKFGGRTFAMTVIGDSKYETEIKNDTLTLSTFEYSNRDQRIYVKLKQ